MFQNKEETMKSKTKTKGLKKEKKVLETKKVISYGKRLKNLLKSLDIDQKELADKLETSPQNISQILKRTYPSLETIVDILEVIGVDPGDFFRDDEDVLWCYTEDEREILSLLCELPVKYKTLFFHTSRAAIECLFELANKSKSKE